jgi:hypothetical protein
VGLGLNIFKTTIRENEFLSDLNSFPIKNTIKKIPMCLGPSHHIIQYEPGESRSGMFGGNSNWRGPIWMPLNYNITNVYILFGTLICMNFQQDQVIK